MNEPDLRDVNYWEDRYKGEDEFDWFQTYEDVREELKARLSATSKIIVLGCGNSSLSDSLFQDGYPDITNVDYSSTCIEAMRLKHPHMRYTKADVRQMEAVGHEYDVAIDKGTMDVFLATRGSKWDPPEVIVRDCRDYLHEVHRILAPNGLFIWISFTQPHFAKPRLLCPGMELETCKVLSKGKGLLEYFLYVLRKS